MNKATQNQATSNKNTAWKRPVSMLVVLCAAAIGAYFWQQSKVPKAIPDTTAIQPAKVEVAAPASPIAATLPAPAPPDAPAITHYPVDASLQAAAAALPSLAASDPAMLDGLSALLGKMPIQQLLRPQEIVRRIVVTIDNLPRTNAAARLLPTKPVKGPFLTEGEPGNRVIATDNAARYTQYVRLAQRTDAAKLVNFYARHYPLFQRAYQDLGYPDAYFNDRLIAVIDHLLAAPDASAPVALSQPHVLYEFADPALEASSAGHKVLLRMGSENAASIKAKLRQIRAALIEKMPAMQRDPNSPSKPLGLNEQLGPNGQS